MLRRSLIRAESPATITDHKGLLSCLEMPEANPTLQRWATKTPEYKPKFAYLPGVVTHMADLLSRHPNLQLSDATPEERRDEFEEAQGAVSLLSSVAASRPCSAAGEASSPPPWLDHALHCALPEQDDFRKSVL